MSYYKEDAKVYCFTHGRWWRNLQGGAPVQLRLQGEDFAGFAEAVPEDTDRKSKYLSRMLKAVPWDAGIYKVTMDDRGEPNPEQVREAARDAVMIRIDLEA